MKTLLYLQRQSPVPSTHTPKSNPLQPRGFGMDENSQPSTSNMEEVDLDA